jgi:hypothetical protein
LLLLSPGHGAARNNLALLLTERGCRAAALADLDAALAVADQTDPMSRRLLQARSEFVNGAAAAGRSTGAR